MKKNKPKAHQCAWCNEPAIKWAESLFYNAYVPVCRVCLTKMSEKGTVKVREFEPDES
jgi:hypothetical protein